MSGDLRSKFGWMTYLLAGMAGWGIVAFAHPGATVGGENRKAATRTQRDGSLSLPTGPEILARLEAERKAAEGATEYGINDNLRALIAQRLAELPASTDPAGDVRAAIGRLGDLKAMSGDDALLEGRLPERIEVAALFHRWLESDPAAALEYANSLQDNVGFFVTGAAYGIEFWGETADLAKIQDLVLATPNKITSIFLSNQLGRRTGQAGDFAAFAAMYEAMTSHRAEFADAVGKNWPAGEGGELMEFALEHKELSMLGNALQRVKAEEVIEWLDKAMAADGKDMQVERLMMNYGWKILDTHRDELGLEGTLALRERFDSLSDKRGESTPREFAAKSVINSDVQKAMSDAAFRDVMYSFMEGTTDAAAVLASVKAAVPDSGEAFPDLVQDQVYAVLVAKKPAAAVELLAGLPEAERYQKVNELAYHAIGINPRPERIHELFEAVPHESGVGQEAAREAAWHRVGSKAYALYGDDYLVWLKQLPAGPNRDMAVSAMVQQLERTEPAKANQLRAPAK